VFLRRSLLAALALSLVGAACSSIDEVANGPVPADPLGPVVLAFDDGESQSAQAAGSAGLEGEAAGDGVVRLALVRPESWNPREVSVADRAAMIVADLLYDGLTELGPDGALAPGLATGWTVDGELRTWTFSLDADRVSAEQVVQSFELLRLAQSTTATNAVLSTVDSVAALDQGRVRFVLSEPNGGFAWLLAGLPFSIADGLGNATGTFGVAEDVGGIELVSAGGGPDVSIRWFPTQGEAEEAVVSGGADIAIGVDPGLERPGVSVRRSVRSVSRFLQVNPRSPETGDAAVRLSIAAAVDSGPLARASGSSAVGQLSLSSVSTIGAEVDPCGGKCAFMPDDRAVGAVGGRDLVVAGSLRQGELLAGVAGQMELVDVGASVQTLTEEELLAEVLGGTVDVYAAGWIGEAPTLDGWLPLLLSTGMIDPTTVPEAAEMVAVALETADDEVRWASLRRAEMLVLQSGYVIPVAARADALVVRDGTAEFSVDPDGTMSFASV